MDSQPETTWSDEQKSRLIARIVDGELSAKSACEQHQLSPDELVDWASIYRRSAHDAIDQHLAEVLASQGIEAGALRAAEFSGTLGDLSIADLTQTIAVGRKDAVVSVAHGSYESQLWFDRGELVDAESASLRGVQAAYRILGLDQGSVSARFHRAERTRTIYTSLPRLLLEAARRKDESAVLRKFVGETDFVYLHIAGASTHVAANPAEVATIALFDGSRTLAEVLAANELGDLETLQLTARLLEQDYLMPRGRRAAEETAPPSEVGLAWTSMSSLMFELTRVQVGKLWRGKLEASALALALIAAAISGSPFGLVASSECKQALEPDTSQSSHASIQSVDARELFVDLQPEPRDAEVWLDGERAGTGSLALRLARDGRLHEVRVSAPGYVSQTLLFTDRPPVGRVALTPLAADHAPIDVHPLLAPQTRAERAAPAGSGTSVSAPTLSLTPASPAAAALSRTNGTSAVPHPRLLPSTALRTASERELVASDLQAGSREHPRIRLLE